MAEVTVKSVLLGSVLGVVLGAANTYLGLYAGMTVSASIPAAVLSMAILRGVFRSGTILENNIVQTIAASGESLAAGIIFTVPALLITGVWKDIQFWPTTLICIAGGLLGIVFMVPLRRTLIVEDKTLKFPEGTACAQVLIAGESKGDAARFMVLSTLFGAAVKFLSAGVSIFRGSLESAFALGKTALFIGAEFSPALIGVGFIVGLNVACTAFLGGFITWGLAIPVMGAINGVQGDPLEWFWGTWSSQARYLGVGAMTVAAVHSVLEVRHGMLSGLKEAFFGYKSEDGSEPLRTERNMSRLHLLILLFIAIGITFGLYQYLVGSFGLSLLATFVMVLMSFFFVAITSYVVGLLGSSNSPVSGMVICSVLITAGFFLLFGFTGAQGVIATLGVAGVVCCATCSAGDISQDLKTGYILGATPAKQQWMEVLGAVIPAFVMAPIMIVLNHAYGIGTGQPGSLRAPQATLFASLTDGIFGKGNVPWSIVLWGAGIGVLIVIIDEVLKRSKSSLRVPAMAVAVGMYLPIGMTSTMLLGGLVSHFVKNRSDSGMGVLAASGLIAGEALMGVVIGIVIYLKKDALPIPLFDSLALSAVALLGICIMLHRIAKKDS